MTTEQHKSGLLYGFEAIAAYLHMTPRQAKHRAAMGAIPTFKIGRNVCARRVSLDAWLADLEAKAKGARNGEA